MGNNMNRRERLMATLNGKPVDRPAVSLYEIGGKVMNPADEDRFNIYNSSSWKPLLELTEEKTDLIRLRYPAISQRDSDKKCRGEFFKEEKYLKDGSFFTRTTLQVAGRTMTAQTRRDPDIDTIWHVEHLLKDSDDVKAYLELPDEVFAEEVDTTSLIEEDQQLGDAGIIMVDTGDPLCAAASLFDMQNYLIIAMTEQKLFHQLLEKHARYIQKRTELVAKEFPGHLWRIYGPEYAGEPYMPPSLFEQYVVGYTGEMVKAIKKHGGFARIHCHGKLRSILDLIVGMGADATDPIEPPPQGDVELEYVRGKYGKELVLFGNLEIADIENMEPTRFEKVVQKTLEDGTMGRGRGFVLTPSASPYGREITATTMTNYETIVRLATGFNL
jgi:uroporphyrinogen-III decarboxylase